MRLKYIALIPVLSVWGFVFIFIDWNFVNFIFIIWCMKTISMQKIKGDDFNHENFMYGILPATGMIGILNTARPLSFTEFNGRVVIGGGWVWCVRRNRFKKIPLAHIDLSSLIMVDTGEAYNSRSAARLDGRLGKMAVYGVRDCASLRVEKSLENMIINRIINRLMCWYFSF